MADETTRQDAFRDQANQTFADSLGLYQGDRPRQDFAQAGAERAASIRETAQSDTLAAPARASTPAIVNEERARTGDQASRSAGQFADALGMTGAHGTAMFNRGVPLGRNAIDLGQTASLASGSAGIVPLELNAANQAGAKLSGIADIFSGLGQAGLGYSLFGTGAKPGWGDLFSAPASASFRGTPLALHP
jgi:hypothetical protein